jgi:hypothetical protein
MLRESRGCCRVQDRAEAGAAAGELLNVQHPVSSHAAWALLGFCTRAPLPWKWVDMPISAVALAVYDTSQGASKSVVTARAPPSVSARVPHTVCASRLLQWVKLCNNQA